MLADRASYSTQTRRATILPVHAIAGNQALSRTYQDQPAHEPARPRRARKEEQKLQCLLYKKYYDRNAKPPSEVRGGHQVYVQRPLNYALYQEERVKNARRSKLLPKSNGPFTETAARGNVVTIVQDGMRHLVSIDRITPTVPR